MELSTPPMAALRTVWMMHARGSGGSVALSLRLGFGEHARR
jgi:hypothetical protein